MIVKCGRREFDINHSDVILDNGACVQILTKSIHENYSDHPPVMSKKLFSTLIKNGNLSEIRRDGSLIYYRVRE